MTAAFDTLRFARALREKAKLSPEQAEGLADAMAEAMQQDVATKSDIRGLENKLGEMEFRFQVGLRETEARLEANLRELDARLQGDMRSLEGRLELNLRDTETRLELKLRELEGSLELKQRELEGRLQADLRQTEMRLAAEIAATREQIGTSKTDILKWMFGMIGFQTVVILGTVIALSRLGSH